MQSQITITYTWHRADGKRVKEAHKEALRERAIERATEMAAEGYREGELNDNIRMTDRDPEDGIEYHGWWKIK